MRLQNVQGQLRLLTLVLPSQHLPAVHAQLQLLLGLHQGQPRRRLQGGRGVGDLQAILVLDDADKQGGEDAGSDLHL